MDTNKSYLDGNSSETLKEFALAFTQMQAQLTNAPFDSTNPHFRNKYASLAGIINHIRPIIAKFGFSFLQMTNTSADSVSIETILLHSSGEFVKSITSLKVSKNDPQGMGSAFTYAKRYGLSAILGIASEEDDDGEAAQKSVQTQKQSTQQPQKQNTSVSQKTAPIDYEKMRINSRQIWQELFDKGADLGTARDGQSMIMVLDGKLSENEWQGLPNETKTQIFNTLKNAYSKITND